jgi:hypothetical protein
MGWRTRGRRGLVALLLVAGACDRASLPGPASVDAAIPLDLGYVFPEVDLAAPLHDAATPPDLAPPFECRPGHAGAGIDVVPPACRVPEECDGGVCCAGYSVNSGTRRLFCVPWSACAPGHGTDTGATRLCHTDDDCTRGVHGAQWTHCCPDSIDGRATGSCQ